jgi:hypothetical protein
VTQQPLPLVYKEMVLKATYRLDLVVEDTVVVEVKSADRHLILQARHVSGLKQSRSEDSVNFDRGSDHFARDLIERRLNKHTQQSANKAPLRISCGFARRRLLCGVTAYPRPS